MMAAWDRKGLCAPDMNCSEVQSTRRSTSERQEETHLPGQFFPFTGARRPDILRMSAGF